MNNLRRYYNQNRKKIWGIIIVIAFAFVLLQLANELVKNKNQKEIRQAQIQAEQQNTNEGNSNKTISSDVTNYDSSRRTKQSTATNTISEFLSYCNNKELDKAYEMISDECKEQMFNNIETFERIYYESAFENRIKEFSIEKWINNTYMVKINENALANGKSSRDNQKTDYITPVKDDNNNYKLNINNYIGYKPLNKKKEQDGIQFEVLGRHIYFNYEEYVIKVTNNTTSEIQLDQLDTTRSLYIKDSNGAIYPAYKHELSPELLTFSGGHTRQLNIKFYSTYSSTKKIKELVFEEVKQSNNIKEVIIEI